MLCEIWYHLRNLKQPWRSVIFSKVAGLRKMKKTKQNNNNNKQTKKKHDFSFTLSNGTIILPNI